MPQGISCKDLIGRRFIDIFRGDKNSTAHLAARVRVALRIEIVRDNASIGAGHSIVHLGEPYFKITALCKREGVAVFSPNFELYGDMSSRVMKMLEDACPGIEIYSIDEAFLELAGRCR